MDRTASRFAVRALAWAAVPVLLVAGCSSSSDDDGQSTDDAPQTVAPTPEPVRFSGLPDPCATLGEGTIEEIVPEADPAAGEAVDATDDPESSASCLWTGLDEYQFRSLTVALRRFDSDVAIGSGDERAGQYQQQMAEEITGDGDHTDVEAGELAETGEAATSIGYNVVKETEETGEQEYRQHRVVARTGNVVVLVDYSATGFEGDDMPSAETVKESADNAAREVVTALDESAESQTPGDDASEGATEPEGTGEDTGGEDASQEDPPANEPDNDAREEGTADQGAGG